MNLTERVRWSRRVTLLSYAALLAALVTGWIANQPSVSNLDLLLIKTLPLLIFLPGLLRGNSMTHLWMSCVLLLYVIISVLNFSLANNMPFSAIESISSIILFTSTMLFVRYSRLKRAGQSIQPVSGTTKP